MKKRRVLITGGAGFIGSHVTKALLRTGSEVVVLDNLCTGSLKNLPKHSRLLFVRKDLNKCQVKDVPGKIDSLIHLAASPSVSDSWQNVLEAHRNNSTSTLAALELGKKKQIKRFLYASSAAIYGSAGKSAVSEKTVPAPLSPYGVQKLLSEKYINLFAVRYSFSAVILRLFNVYGHSPVLPGPGVVSVVEKAFREKRPFILYGDGGQTRDFIYVKDVVLAFKQALQISLPVGSVQTCNIAGGQALSLRQLVSLMEKIFARRLICHRLPVQPGDIRHSLASTAKAEKILKFKAKYSLEEGIRDMMKSLCR